MGTNYYLKTTVELPIDGFNGNSLHLGKSSSGWHFSLHVYPEYGLVNWYNMLVVILLVIEGTEGWIESEYGDIISFASFYDTVVNRKGRWTEDCSEDFLRINRAERGLAGLLMSKIDSEHCIGRGIGTYDYFIGDFS